MKKFIPFFVVAFVFIISLALFISPYNQLQDETNSTIKEITAKRNELALLDLSHKSTLDEFQEHKDVYSESQSKENLDTLNSFFDNWYPSEFRSKRDAWIKMFKGTYPTVNENTIMSMFPDNLFLMQEPTCSITDTYVTSIDETGVYSYMVFVDVKDASATQRIGVVYDYKFIMECRVKSGNVLDIVSYKIK